MKINKSFLSKIIKEEIKRALYDEEPLWAKEAVNVFMDIRSKSIAANPERHTKENFLKQIEQLTGQPAVEVFSYLRGKIDKDLYVHVAQLLNSVVDINLLGDEDLMSPSYKSKNPTRSEIDDVRSPYKTDAPSTYNRKPQPISPQDQDDPRDKKKNWVHENKAFFLLKNLILETLDESKKEELKNKFPQFADKIDFLSSNGIVGSELQWATKQLNNNNVEDILKNIQDFIKNKPKLKIKDINQYKSFDDLKSSLENRELSGKEKEKKEKASAQTFFNDENFALIRPYSINSSCYYGSNTKWCISAKEGNRFAEYSRHDAKFYFIISKKSKDEKYAKIAYSILPIKNVSKIPLLKIDKLKDFIDGETVVQIYDSSDKKMSRQDVSNIIGAELENKLFSIMLNDYKTGVESIVLADEEKQNAINKIKDIIKSYNERNFEQVNKSAAEIDEFLRSIEGTRDYYKIINEIAPYAKEYRIIRTRLYMFMPKEISQIFYDESKSAQEDAYKNLKFATKNIKQGNLEKALLEVEKTMLYFFEFGRRIPYEDVKNIFINLKNLIKDPNNKQIKEKVLIDIKSMLGR